MFGSTGRDSSRASRNKTRKLSVACASILCAFASGCSEELGPERFLTTTVNGRLVSLGKPVGPCWIEFIPADGTTGNLRTARVTADGSFHADKVPVGRVAIALARIPIESIPTTSGLVPTRIFHFTGTPIRRTIPEISAGPIEIDLGVEAYRFSQEQAALRKVREGAGG